MNPRRIRKESRKRESQREKERQRESQRERDIQKESCSERQREELEFSSSEEFKKQKQCD